MDGSAESAASRPVLILGAGINGAALARELVVGGLPVVVVDTGDLARGATAYSSRLIHGGLRYLEYGEFDLVRESLAERTRLLRLAPQFVHPLQLHIPVGNRLGGLQHSLARFFGRDRHGAQAADARAAPPRGLWLVRAGLWLYDLYARDSSLPRHRVSRLDGQASLPIDRARYRWLCSYFDAQIRFPERFVVALFDDARRAAKTGGFQLFTYHRVELAGRTISIYAEENASRPAMEFEPAAVINATGAWVDATLRQLHASSPPLMGGTKGSHLITFHAGLRVALGDAGIYAEAADGRPVFILPLGEAALVGTTDLPYLGDPADAVATDAEVDYLVAAVNQVLPGVRLTRDDVEFHYCGVRPLPHANIDRPAAITRRHWLEEHTGSAVPLYSVIGGKLTTCRSLAELSARTIRRRLGLTGDAPTSRDRSVPGAEGYPSDRSSLEAAWRSLAETHGWSVAQVRAIWQLRGTQTGPILAELAPDDRASLQGVDLPVEFVRWVIGHEWVRRLDDLVERRLMLLY
ncbi:MAG: glycerol-3-phosphate dehydrogenase/oxidase, partial [Candidatus Saccharimonadales bacterium]